MSTYLRFSDYNCSQVENQSMYINLILGQFVIDLYQIKWKKYPENLGVYYLPP